MNQTFDMIRKMISEEVGEVMFAMDNNKTPNLDDENNEY